MRTLEFSLRDLANTFEWEARLPTNTAENDAEADLDAA
jgi:hypothetical protein